MTADERNTFRFRLSPDLAITLGARVKRPGDQMMSEPADLELVHHPSGDELGDYERLLVDAMAGDAMLFAREDAVEAAWAIVDPILGNVTPVEEYAPGTWGPKAADELTSAVGGWHAPAAGGNGTG